MLTPLANGADLLVAGFNEQGLAANIAAYYGIPLVALHFFPERFGHGSAVFAHHERHRRRATPGTGPAGG